MFGAIQVKQAQCILYSDGMHNLISPPPGNLGTPCQLCLQPPQLLSLQPPALHAPPTRNSHHQVQLRTLHIPPVSTQQILQQTLILWAVFKCISFSLPARQEEAPGVPQELVLRVHGFVDAHGSTRPRIACFLAKHHKYRSVNTGFNIVI